MAPKSRLLALAFSAALTVVPRAEATLARAMKFDDKVENAASIIVGKCVASRSQWDAEHRWILTYSTFQVEDSMKGRGASEITIVTPGGEVGGLHQDTIGVPSFRVGDENVVFTKDTSLGPTVLYFDQGAYDVGPGDRDSRVVTPRPTGAVLVDTQRGTAYEPEHARTLGEFKREVRDSIERTRAQKMELIRGRKQPQSIASVPLHYKLLIALAVIGATIATVQLLRR
jgi:hypothetical protein